MKTLLTLSLLLASTAMAKPVAVIKASGGFMIHPTTTTLTVDSNGMVTVETVVTSFEEKVKPEITKVKVARLNANIVATIVNDVAEANNTKIVADDADGPICMDAPAVVFSALKDGVWVEIGKNINCKAYFLEDYQARTAMTLLENLRTLSFYSK